MSFNPALGEEDNFGKLIADSTQGRIDIPSHFDFSPRRLRLFLNGTRQFVQYGTASNFRDEADTWVLDPGASDTMFIESTKSVSYSVNFTMETSAAFNVNQSLVSGDRIRFGPYTDQDGWFIEQRGGDHTDTQVDIVERRAGTRTVLATDVELPEPTTVFNRYDVKWSWYNVGNQKWEVTFTSNGRQVNESIARTSNDAARGPETGNLPVRCEVTASSGTTGLEMNAGSMAQVLLGNTRNLVRTHPADVTVQVPNTADTWIPVHALRLDPNGGDANVNAQLQDLSFLKYGNDALVEIRAISVDPSKTDASGFSEPRLVRNVNAAFQTTNSVSTIPNDSGTVVTPTPTTSPGGFNVSYISARPAGNNFKEAGATVVPGNEEIKRGIFGSDVIVFLVKTPNPNAQLSFGYVVDEDW